MKKALVVAIFVALAGSVYGQSIANLARQEKARREALGGNRARVVTNADLAFVRKTPAVIVVTPETASESNAEGIAATESSAGGVDQSAGETSGEVVTVPAVGTEAPSLSKDGKPSSRADAEARLKVTNELIDLLTTKLNALMQEASSLNTMTPKDVLDRQIAETNQKLLRVQDQAAKLKAQIEAGKNNPPEIR